MSSETLALLTTIAKARAWIDDLVEGQVSSFAEIAQREGIQWLQVPYKGAADALIALRGGHVTAMADSSTWGEMVDAGQVRLLVTWGENRTRRWPNVPTLKDLGYGIVSNSPYGIAGPKGMDPKVVKILHDAIRKAMDDPAYQKVLERLD